MKQIIIGKKWPGGISDGLLLPCEICGKHSKFDYVVSDNFWEKVVPSNYRRGVICLPCLDEISTKCGEDVSIHLYYLQFTGIGKTVVLKPVKVYLYETDKGNHLYL